jgi:TetR/AcrR family transcriptional regulator, repressor of fatR-cypB operon
MSKKEDILVAALELFAERGYYGTSVGLITELAGVAAGTIYRHFKDKQDLMNVLFRECQTKFNEASNKGLKDGLTARQKLARLWQNMLEFATHHQKELTLIELHYHAPYLDDQSQQLVAKHYSNSLKWWSGLREEQITKDMPPEIFRALMSGMFFGLLKAAKSKRLELDETVTQMVDLMSWEAFRA